MSTASPDAHVGYSVFEIFEECWQYNENACFIASTEAAARVFMSEGWVPASKWRIEAVSFTDIMRDFGYSSGEYAQEGDAFGRFQQLAESRGVDFEAEPYDGDETLLVVHIDGVARQHAD
jgi:hypothetical protein